ncbi:NAD(P)H-binding protein [Arthrobacter sp. AL12]|uniref:NAD(P)H-binding protein n=1 Tax=Arthrobacter sp. AL12 TaxID=3042241 RepID=UPI0032B81D1A
MPAGQIVAAGRDLAKVADLAGRGVQARQIDYHDPASLRRAFAGAGKVLLISGSDVGQRLEQQRNAIEAAKDAGVGLIAYTSIANASRTDLQLAAEHQATEEALSASGLPFTLLRNGWYLESYTDQLGSYLQQGAMPAARETAGSARPPEPAMPAPPRRCSSAMTRPGRSTSSAATCPSPSASWRRKSVPPPGGR